MINYTSETFNKLDQEEAKLSVYNIISKLAELAAPHLTNNEMVDLLSSAICLAPGACEEGDCDNFNWLCRPIYSALSDTLEFQADKNGWVGFDDGEGYFLADRPKVEEERNYVFGYYPDEHMMAQMSIMVKDPNFHL